jgi:hypothetical protein
VTCADYIPYNWTSVPITSIGYASLIENATLSFQIPAVIPYNSGEVLILATVFTENFDAHPLVNLAVYTQIGHVRYEKYLSYIPYSAGMMVNSDNMWFPMSPNGLVFVNIPFALNNPTNAGFHLYAIGYR